MATDFQTNLFDFISKYIAEHGSSPSYNEMIAAMGISSSSKSLINRSLRALRMDGKISLQKEGRRLLITPTSKQLPLIGRISAGTPIEAIEEYPTMDIDQLLYAPNRFALEVDGNSMIDDGIFDGDIIICKQAQTAHEGEIIVALIDQQNTTLKRISYKVPGMITLIPSNPELKPRAYAPERIGIQGIYIGLVRIG